MVESTKSGKRKSESSRQPHMNAEGTTVSEKLDDLTVKGPLGNFVYMDSVKKILDVASTSGENVILYGPGGYGKSEFTLEYYKTKGIDPYVITMGTGMTTDRMFGGLNIPVFNATGKVEYLVENSFMAAEHVIFEELFDAPDFILEQLKDILSSGVFRNGTQIYPIKTKLIICCTNKTREEFSKNNSLKALMERFPLETKVQWKDHNKITYENLLNTKLGFADPMLTYILEEYAKAGNTISPRIAIKAANIVAQAGPEALTFIADFNTKPDLLKSSIAKFESIFKINEMIQKMKQMAIDLTSTPFDTIENVKKIASINKLLLTKIIELKAIKADDSMISMTTEAIKVYDAVYNKTKKQLDIILSVDEAFKDVADVKEEEEKEKAGFVA